MVVQFGPFTWNVRLVTSPRLVSKLFKNAFLYSGLKVLKFAIELTGLSNVALNNFTLGVFAGFPAFILFCS